MDKFNVINNQKFTVGKIQKQRIDITHKKKGKGKSMISIYEIGQNTQNTGSRNV